MPHIPYRPKPAPEQPEPIPAPKEDPKPANKEKKSSGIPGVSVVSLKDSPITAQELFQLMFG